MSKHAAALVLLLALSGGIALYAWRSRGTTPTSEARNVVAAEVPRGNEAHERTVGLEADPGLGTRAHASIPASEAGASSRLSIQGLISVTGADGRARDHEDGTITLAILTSTTHEARTVVIESGAFQFECDPGSHARVDGIVLGGRRALLVGGGSERPLRASGEWIVRARWTTGAVLRVLDAKTRRELEGVEIVRPRTAGGSSAMDPGIDHERVLEAASSPIEIARRADIEASGLDVLFVRARGFAWGRVEVRHDSEREHVVELGPGGDVSVQVEGFDAARPSVLRVRRGAETANEPWVERSLQASGAVALESLPVGILMLTVEHGDWWSVPRVLGGIEVDVLPGARVDARIRIEIEPRVATVDLAGTIHLPKEWNVAVPALQVVRLDSFDVESVHAGTPATVTAASSADRWLWTTAGVEPGAYELRLLEPAFGVLVDVDAAGRRDVDIEVPEATRIRVTCVDDATGAASDLEDLYWFAERATSGREPTHAPLRAASGAFNAAIATGRASFEIVAPRGRIHLVPGGDRYAGAETIVSALGPSAEAIVRLQPATELVLRLTSAGAVVPWNSSWSETIRAVEGDGVGWAFATNERGRVLRFTKPGRYRIQLAPLPGFAALPEFEVEAQAYTKREHVIELVRIP